MSPCAWGTQFLLVFSSYKALPVLGWWDDVCVCVCVCVCSLLSCVQLCDTVDYNPPGFSVYWILQARILEWVAISFSRGSSQLRNWTWVFSIAGGFFTVWATRDTDPIKWVWKCCLPYYFLEEILQNCNNFS